MNDKIKELCRKVYPEAIELRRKLHENPELGRKEFDTTKLIKAYLDELGIENSQPLETGIVATIYGKNPGRTVALRADIDALPITENADVSFISKNNGIMHACGHDMHTAALLGAAKVLKMLENELYGNVRLIFQPDEEGDGGAQRLIDKGALEGVDEIYGIHVRPELPCGTVSLKYGKSYAASDIFEIKVIGKGGHCAEPDKNIDAILVASHIVTALQTIVSRNVAPTESAVITVGTINGGVFRNSIAETCEITGVMRSLGKDMRLFLRKRLTEISKGTAEAMGAKLDMKIIESYPGIVNDDEKTAYAEKCAIDLYGKDRVKVSDTPGMVSEDFGYYLDKIPGAFIHIGCESENVLHSELFCPDEKALLTMMEIHVKICTG